MMLRKWMAAAGLATLGFLATVTAGFAYNVTSTTTLNVRSGPSTGYAVQYVMRPGDVRNCVAEVGSWCRFGDGNYASRSYLRPVSGNRGGNNPPQTGGRPDPDVGFCIEGENFSFGVNCDPDQGDRNRPNHPRYGEVCFYEHVNFRGRSFCERPGDRDNRLSPFWNDRISSIDVKGNASAVVCRDVNYQGCWIVNADRRRLNRNDEISSYRIRPRWRQ
ncbi:peptidase inhibitor family I36 protein [Cucumibacter marinus]|uniref:peptidase inhibitor family I36 protein n=1 Tax=Cucumibacter marinus TaxID=1121252 RepID=UPI00041903BA|nr:peptidase inhibitor family I36 protein [Cucumibacter marinus]